MTNHETEPKKKYPGQRLVGALVLLALAVIIVPMILDFRKGYDVTIDKTNIPPKPADFRVEILPLIDEQRVESPAVAPVGQPSKAEASADTRQTEAARPEKTVTIKKSAVASSEGDGKATIQTSRGVKPVTTSPHAAQMKQAGKAVPAKKETANIKPLAGKPDKKLSTTLPAPSAWVLQLGSFESRGNAIALRNRLRKNGFRAFVDDIVVSGKKINRVFVGPELVKINTDILKRELKEDMNLNGMVIPYR